MVNVLLLLKRIQHFSGVEHISCISNTYILLVLKLSLISMSWSYLPQFVSMLITVLHINIMLSSFSHEACYPSFHGHYASYLQLHNVHILNINYAFEFIGEMSHFMYQYCVLTHMPKPG